jgi:hypothetical protein
MLHVQLASTNNASEVATTEETIIAIFGGELHVSVLAAARDPCWNTSTSHDRRIGLVVQKQHRDVEWIESRQSCGVKLIVVVWDEL